MNDLKSLPPIIHRCMTIGAIPTSYKMSLTYEEQLMWFCKFLEDEVIPVVNNNSAVVEELKEIIENLDIQEEVNNKLEEMAESGELAEIINTFLVNTTVVFDTVADMQASEILVENANCKVLGYYSIGDGGEATFKVETTEGDYGIAIANGLYANFVIPANKIINVKQFGCVGDGETDDYTHLNKAMQFISNHECTLVNDEQVVCKTYIDILATNDIHLAGTGAYLFDLTNRSQHALKITTIYNVTIDKGLLFDFKYKSYDGIRIENVDSDLVKNNIVELNGEFQNVNRYDTSMSGGNIIHLRGLIHTVNLNCKVRNAKMSTGAGIEYSQGVSGVSLARYVDENDNNKEYSAQFCNVGNDFLVENIYSEDSTYYYDQDGLKLFGKDLVATISSNATFKDCKGRFIKAQNKYNDISGKFYCENYIAHNGGIDIQRGGANVHDVVIYNNCSDSDNQSAITTSVIKYSSLPNEEMQYPNTMATFKNITYIAKELSNNYRLRRLFMFTPRN